MPFPFGLSRRRTALVKDVTPDSGGARKQCQMASGGWRHFRPGPVTVGALKTGMALTDSWTVLVS